MNIQNNFQQYIIIMNPKFETQMLQRISMGDIADMYAE